MDMLASTSRTFYIPISRLVPGLKEAVASAYLCMRAIDEIEDHPELASALKVELLLGVGRILRENERETKLQALFAPHEDMLPEVTLRLNDWVAVCPESIMDTVLQSTAVMAEGMAEWVEKRWAIRTEEDLDHYTYCVAGAVGELLSDLWMWYDGTQTDRVKAVAFGRGLQAVNILSNRMDDSTRGVSFFPEHWGMEEMIQYTRKNLQLADEYIADLKRGPVLNFCSIPLALAHGTLKAITAGKSKLNRAAVLEIVSRVMAGKITL
ncbi:squalene/phytoene synthase family protein [Paenibacillus doosanensis]|uniref:squalene/phytoene synthase family protein n=1 Tax=Paenibacillus doosanensis TaxID=1229154 RepID=UPI002180232C|nr:squalene/phytoene synthase family protein [Paenibacillus doosanensis]MCS7461576.1 squalene/phytoene synthase family protein [Paenibacillus doosanensis]